MSKTFTTDQINNWKMYEKIRKYGKYNMFDFRARELSNMDSDEWLFCLENYCELKQAVERDNREATF